MERYVKSTCSARLLLVCTYTLTPTFAAAPGTAPVVDPCGQAGGKYKQTPMGGDSVFQTVSVPGDKTYQMGDLGSKVLPEHPDAVTTWKIGTTPRVAWGMRYNQ